MRISIERDATWWLVRHAGHELGRFTDLDRALSAAAHRLGGGEGPSPASLHIVFAEPPPSVRKET